MATFSYVPDQPVKVEILEDTIISSMGKYEQRRSALNDRRKLFTFSFSMRGNTETTAIEAFYEARSGAVESFGWTDPVTSAAYTLRFVPNSFNRTYLGRSGAGHLWNITFQCMEVN